MEQNQNMQHGGISTATVLSMDVIYIRCFKDGVDKIQIWCHLLEMSEPSVIYK